MLFANMIQWRGPGFIPLERNTANQPLPLGNIHNPACVSLVVAAHYISNHGLSEGARGIVIGQRHAPGGLAVIAIGVVDGKGEYNHPFILNQAALAG